MESQTQTQQFLNQFQQEQLESSVTGKIEFQAIRTTYSNQENLYCYFMVPPTASVKPESGDFVGIYKVGWTSLKDWKCRKMVRTEDVWGSLEKCGQVIFEAPVLPSDCEKYYQFVYVKGGESIKGASKPFLFEETKPCEYEVVHKMQPFGVVTGPQELEVEVSIQQSVVQQVQKPTIAGLKQQTNIREVLQQLTSGHLPQHGQQHVQGQRCTTLRQNLQQLFEQDFKPVGQFQGQQYVQGGQYVQGQQYVQGGKQLRIQQQHQQLESILGQFQEQQVQGRQYVQGQQQVGQTQQQVQQVLVKETEQRRRELTRMNTQLRLLERQAEQQQRKEVQQQQHQQQKVQQQVAEFEQKVQNVLKAQSVHRQQIQGQVQFQGPQEQQVQQVEKYVARYETLLQEKVELEFEARQKVLCKVLQIVRRCAAQLRDQQQCEIEYLVSVYQQINDKFATVNGEIEQVQGVQTIQTVQEIKAEIKQIAQQFYAEEQRHARRFAQMQSQLVSIIEEVDAELCELIQQQQQQQVCGQYRMNYQQQPQIQVNGHWWKQMNQQLGEYIQQNQYVLPRVHVLEKITKQITLICGEQSQQYQQEPKWCREVLNLLRSFDMELTEQMQQQLQTITPQAQIYHQSTQMMVRQKMQTLVQLIEQQQQQFQFQPKQQGQQIAKAMRQVVQVEECLAEIKDLVSQGKRIPVQQQQRQFVQQQRQLQQQIQALKMSLQQQQQQYQGQQYIQGQQYVQGQQGQQYQIEGQYTQHQQIKQIQQQLVQLLNEFEIQFGGEQSIYGQGPVEFQLQTTCQQLQKIKSQLQLLGQVRQTLQQQQQWAHQQQQWNHQQQQWTHQQQQVQGQQFQGQQYQGQQFVQGSHSIHGKQVQQQRQQVQCQKRVRQLLIDLVEEFKQQPQTQQLQSQSPRFYEQVEQFLQELQQEHIEQTVSQTRKVQQLQQQVYGQQYQGQQTLQGQVQGQLQQLQKQISQQYQQIQQQLTEFQVIVQKVELEQPQQFGLTTQRQQQQHIQKQIQELSAYVQVLSEQQYEQVQQQIMEEVQQQDLNNNNNYNNNNNNYLSYESTEPSFNRLSAQKQPRCQEQQQLETGLYSLVEKCAELNQLHRQFQDLKLAGNKIEMSICEIERLPKTQSFTSMLPESIYQQQQQRFTTYPQQETIEIEQTKPRSACPVCGVKVASELAQYELHVQGHFTD